MFSSTCVGELVPGMGRTTGERRSSQARATWGRGQELFGDLLHQSCGFACLAERRPGHEADVVLLTVIEEVIPLAVGEAVAVLHGDDGDDFAGALDVLERDVGEADVADFALFAQLGQSFHGGLERDGGIGDMELLDIDALELEPL